MYRVLELNPQLSPFEGDIEARMYLYRTTKARLLSKGQTLKDFANGHKYYGFHHVDGGWYYREWAPAAEQLYLEGEFNAWNPTSHPMNRLDDENWEIYLPGDDALWHGCKVKTVVEYNGVRTEHFALYTQRAVQNQTDNSFDAEIVDDKITFPWTDQEFIGEDQLYIYEAHVGMAQEEGRIGT